MLFQKMRYFGAAAEGESVGPNKILTGKMRQTFHHLVHNSYIHLSHVFIVMLCNVILVIITLKLHP